MKQQLYQQFVYKINSSRILGSKHKSLTITPKETRLNDEIILLGRIKGGMSMSDVKKYIVETRLSKDERECILNYSEADDIWYADVSVAKLRNKFIKKGWKLTSETVLPDGTWVASTFEAPYWAVSVRSSEKAVREISDEQRQRMSERAKELFGKE